MLALPMYSNLINTVLNILARKGFRMWYDEALKMYCAEKDGWDFMADSPSGLLGLVAIYEFKQPTQYENDWWKDNDKDFYELSEKKPKYNSVIFKK